MRIVTHTFRFALFGSFLMLLILPACGGLSSHCSDYCERWHDCIDSSLNEDKCVDACHDWADGNSDREAKVEGCSDCLSQNEVCSETGKRCTADCFGIPVQ